MKKYTTEEMLKLKVVSIATEDEDMIEWLESNDINVSALKVNFMDQESELVWFENCPYALKLEDVWFVAS